MKTIDLKDEIKNIQPPILILSSKAGLGNYSVGSAIQEMLEHKTEVFHCCIEDLISARLKKDNFIRYRLICERYPRVLYLIDNFPLNYWVKYKREYYLGNLDISILGEYIKTLDIKTILVTNQRAAFWATALRRRKTIDCSIWAFLTDYSIMPGWKYLFWGQVEKIFGPVEQLKIPFSWRNKYRQIEIPVFKKFYSLAEKRGDINNALITGGGWGLGDIGTLSKKMAKSFPRLNLHIAVGDNARLYKYLSRHFVSFSNVHIYKELNSLYSLMEICESVVTKPGAVTIAEAYCARRKIFLIKGLPGCEYRNLRYALNHFGAHEFSLGAFRDWHNIEKAYRG